MLDWMKHKLESRLPGGNINNLRCAGDITLMAESEELKSLLMKAADICSDLCMLQPLPFISAIKAQLILACIRGGQCHRN